jgi:hypothetical protein
MGEEEGASFRDDAEQQEFGLSAPNIANQSNISGSWLVS